MTVIAIDSDPGSDGDLIAATIAAQLGLNLVEEACLFERLKRKGVPIPPSIPGEDETFPWQCLGTQLRLEVLRLAQQDQILIHWPCATYLLAEVGHVPRIKVRAPLSLRVRRHAARCGCDEQEARRRIQQHETTTQFLLNKCFGIDWADDARGYSLVADTGWLAAADWADEIVDLAGDAEFVPTPASEATLRWLLLQLPQEPETPMPCDCGLST
jgi:cytidylate kinase